MVINLVKKSCKLISIGGFINVNKFKKIFSFVLDFIKKLDKD